MTQLRNFSQISPLEDMDAPPNSVWLRIPEGEDEAEAEANTWRCRTTSGKTVWVVGWYLNAVGLVMWGVFSTKKSADRWLESNGFDDYTT